MTRFIFITGGVVSSLGKGIASASLGALLQARGYKVRLRKLDPYLNVDPGTMSPYQHGEVFVTTDGMESDLDLGHYERFTGVNARKGDCITQGKIYQTLLSKERKGDYLGNTVQVIPHVTDLIKDFIKANVKGENFVICEIGGTVGDIEALPFLEAIRQLGFELTPKKSIFIHLTLVPYIASAKELKTKPTQHSVKELRSIGITPNILLCRSEKNISDEELGKIALFCNISKNKVIPALDQKNIYNVLTEYHNKGLDTEVLSHFKIKAKEPNLETWYNIIEKSTNPSKEVNIGIVGKYNKLEDAYKSLIEAFEHAGIDNDCRIKINWINSSSLKENNIKEKLQNIKAICVPGGFGDRGIEGKILAIKYARENKIPFLGICLGMQLAAIEFARNVLGINDASSSEFNTNGTNIVGLMNEWEKEGTQLKRSKNSDLGGTMRLGNYECKLKKDSLVRKIYNSASITERHRHRYEFNINYLKDFENKGLMATGKYPNNNLIEILELDSHPWFIGVQFHPELQSRPFSPHPLFTSLIKTAINK